MIQLDDLLRHLPEKSTDAVLGMTRLASPALTSHLRNRLSASPGSQDSMLAEPFIEGAFPWQPSPGGWAGLPLELLHDKTHSVLEKVAYPPYAHQVEAWCHLRNAEPRSVIVSSGTGSGRTECFLAPILDRLVGLHDKAGNQLIGVRALMLYPLNALIASQEERLSKWFEAFGGALRYCLYNGETPDELPSGRRLFEPWKVMDRRTLRASSPIRSRRWNLPNTFVLNTLAAIRIPAQSYIARRHTNLNVLRLPGSGHERGQMLAITQIACIGIQALRYQSAPLGGGG